MSTSFTIVYLISRMSNKCVTAWSFRKNKYIFITILVYNVDTILSKSNFIVSIVPDFNHTRLYFTFDILRTLLKFVEIGLRIIYRKSRVSNYGSQKITEMPACWYYSNINKGIFPFVLKINDIHNINHTRGVMICKLPQTCSTLIINIKWTKSGHCYIFTFQKLFYVIGSSICLGAPATRLKL